MGEVEGEGVEGRERPSGQQTEVMPLNSLEAITDALLEIMEVS